MIICDICRSNGPTYPCTIDLDAYEYEGVPVPKCLDLCYDCRTALFAKVQQAKAEVQSLRVKMKSPKAHGKRAV